MLDHSTLCKELFRPVHFDMTVLLREVKEDTAVDLMLFHAVCAVDFMLENAVVTDVFSEFHADCAVDLTVFHVCDRLLCSSVAAEVSLVFVSVKSCVTEDFRFSHAVDAVFLILSQAVDREVFKLFKALSKKLTIFCHVLLIR